MEQILQKDYKIFCVYFVLLQEQFASKIISEFIWQFSVAADERQQKILKN